jgi:hypothetical protein
VRGRRAEQAAETHDDSKTVLAREDKRAAARANRAATAALLSGVLVGAARLFREAVRADRRSFVGWRGVGLAQEVLGRPRAARRAYARYLHLSPDAADAAEVRARVARLSELDERRVR